MINPAAIKEYLKRSLSNFDWMKSERAAALDAALDELNPRPNYLGWWDHQKVCFLLLEVLRRFMLHLDMGAGKTNICLQLIRYRKLRGEKPKAVVFVPYLTAVATWVDEAAKHTPELKCIPLLGTTKENLQDLTATDGDVYVICYQSAVAMVAQPVSAKKRKKRAWTVNPQFIRSCFKGFDTCIFDEVHKCKDVNSLTYRMCRAISAQSEYAIGLTGTPFGKDLQDLWPQFYLIDFGATLGPSLGFYREVFFNQKAGYWGGTKYTFKKKMFKDLQRIIKNVSIRYSLSEFHKLEKPLYVPRYVAPTDGIQAYAERATEKLREALIEGGKEKYRAIESNYLQLRQLSSGFMTLKGEDTERLEIQFEENPKLDLLQEIIEELPEGRKAVVFHHFVFTNNLISGRLKQMKVGHARIWGKQRDPLGELKRFKDDPECRVLVINGKSGSSSLNLQFANYLVFFEQLDSAIDREQAERRVWRPGQLDRVTIYDLMMRGTADDKIRKSNRDGKNLLTELLDGKAQL